LIKKYSLELKNEFTEEEYFEKPKNKNAVVPLEIIPEV